MASEAQAVWTPERLQALPTKELQSIVRSTSPTGDLWLQRTWAMNELDRREKARRRLLARTKAKASA